MPDNIATTLAGERTHRTLEEFREHIKSLKREAVYASPRWEYLDKLLTMICNYEVYGHCGE